MRTRMANGLKRYSTRNKIRQKGGIHMKIYKELQVSVVHLCGEDVVRTSTGGAENGTTTDNYDWIDGVLKQ